MRAEIPHCDLIWEMSDYDVDCFLPGWNAMSQVI